LLINKGFKFRIYPTKEQNQSLRQCGGNARFTYNMLLERNIQYYEETKQIDKAKFHFQNDMINSLPELKQEFEWLNLSFSQSLQQVARQLSQALTNCFQHQSGFPQFKKKQNDDSFAVPQKWRLGKGFVFIPKVGEVKMKKHRPLQGKPKSLTVIQDGEQWFVSILCEVNLKEKEKESFDPEKCVGIDLGIKEFAVISDETIIPSMKTLRKNLKRLKRTQRKLSKKVKGSSNRNKQKRRLQAIHRNVRNIRKDFHHKVSFDMRTKYQVIVMEDLNIQGMLKNHKLALSISDSGWGQFTRFLQYKMEWEGKMVLKIDRWYASSKICSECGAKKVELSLNDRVYICEECGCVMDRDFNASLNIRAEGIRLLEEMLKILAEENLELENGSIDFNNYRKENLLVDSEEGEEQSSSVACGEFSSGLEEILSETKFDESGKRRFR